MAHEASDIDIRGVLIFGASLFATAVLVHVLVWLVFIYFSAREATRVAAQYPLAAASERRLPPEPRLQTNPRQDMLTLRSREDAVLESYGWVDQQAGVVRIPIDQAMKIVVQRGLPTRSGGTR